MLFLFETKTSIWFCSKDGEGRYTISNGGRRLDDPLRDKINIPVHCDGEFMDGYIKDFQHDIKSPVGPEIPTKVEFDANMFQPMLIAGGEDTKDYAIGLISIHIPKGFRLTSFYNLNATVYSYSMDPEKYLDFVVDFTRRGKAAGRPPRISITLHDEETKQVKTFKFFLSNGKIVMVINRMTEDQIPPKGETGFINLHDFVKETIEAGKSPVATFSPRTLTPFCIAEEQGSIDKFNSLIEKKLLRVQDNTKVELVYDTNGVADIAIDKGISAVSDIIPTGYRTIDDFRETDIFKEIMDRFKLVKVINVNGARPYIRVMKQPEFQGHAYLYTK